MIVALSFAVSCSKDEDGGTKTPTTPTAVTITASELNTAIQDAGKNAKLTGATIDFASFSPASGAVSLDATITAEVTLATLKSELETAFTITSGAAITSTATATMPSANTVKDDATLKIEINAGSNNFAEDVSKSYIVSGKTATVEITITPSKKWNNTEN